MTGGGTAGHVTPNIALMPTLKARGFEIYYIGSYDGIEKKLKLPEPANINLFRADAGTLSEFQELPVNFDEAKDIASESVFIRSHIPDKILDIYCSGKM